MTRLAWNIDGNRTYELGVDRGVLYPTGLAGVPWNGLLSVTQVPVGGSTNPYYLDGVKYYSESAPEEFAATIEAYTYPDEFDELDGMATDGSGLFFGEQGRHPFGLSYRTKIGNDLDGSEYGYKIHLVYNALSAPAQRAYQSISDSIDPINFSWSLTTTPIAISGRKPTAHLVLDSRKTDPQTLQLIEDYLYGTDMTSPRLLLPNELLTMMGQVSFEVVRNTATGISELVISDSPDLIGNSQKGIYSATPTSRLVQSSVPGIYDLEI